MGVEAFGFRADNKLFEHFSGLMVPTCFSGAEPVKSSAPVNVHREYITILFGVVPPIRAAPSKGLDILRALGAIKIPPVLL